MVSLEQIRALEARVEKAVELIEKLRRENAELERRLIEASGAEKQVKSSYSELEGRINESLKEALEAAEKASAWEAKFKSAQAEMIVFQNRASVAEHRVAELESRAEELRKDQSRIEEGLTHALRKLDEFEDMVMGISSVGAAAPAEEAVITSGDDKVEAVDESLSTPEPQTDTFHGADHELDIF